MDETRLSTMTSEPLGTSLWIRLTACSPLPIADPIRSVSRADVEVCHDDHGLPFLPGRRLQAMLAESWATLRPPAIAALGDRADAIATELLGTPETLRSGERAGISTARLHPEVEAAVRAASTRRVDPVAAADIVEGLTIVRRATARDRTRGGAPRERSLRTVRCLAPGTELWARADLRSPLATAAHGWLLATLCMATRHMGLGRNRGFGHVRLDVFDDLDADEPITDALAAGNHHPPVRPSVTSAPARPPTPTPTGGGGTARYLHFALTLTAPCVVPAPANTPAHVTTLDHIPGAAIRGAAAAHFRRTGARVAIQEVIENGRARFLNAYPSHDRRRSVPTPLSWKTNAELAWNAEDVFPRTGVDPVDTAADRPLATRFLGGNNGDVVVGADRHTTLHLARARAEPRLGRPTEGDGAVFAYESLPAGTTLEACVVVPDGDPAIVAWVDAAMTEQPLRFGRSASAGYGGWPSVEVVGASDREITAGLVEPIARDLVPGQVVRVLLTSPAIVRDPMTGAFAPEQFGNAFAQALGGPTVTEVVPDSLFVRAEVVGGFDGRYGRLPQAIAAAAGSTVAVEVRSPVTVSTVERVEAEGIGHRVADGYGALLVLPETDGAPLTLTLTTPRAAPAQTPSTPTSPSARAALAHLQHRLDIIAGERIADAVLAGLVHRIDACPSRSLVGRLRAAVASTTDPERSLHALRRQLDALAPPARHQLDACKVAGRSLARRLDLSIAAPTADREAGRDLAGGVSCRIVESDAGFVDLVIRHRVVVGLLAHLDAEARAE